MTPRIAFLNPNATDTMTADMVAVARIAAQGTAEVIGYTNHAGPPAIQGAADAEACLPGLFDLCETALDEGADAIVVGCFDDTGLEEIRARAGRPVTGLGEAGCLIATICRPHFAVLTTTAGSVPVIEANIARMGLAARCRGVFPAHVPVLEIAQRIERVRDTARAIAEFAPGAAIVLGCAGMSTLADRIVQGAPTPTVDPTRAAMALALAAVRMEAETGEAPPPLQPQAD